MKSKTTFMRTARSLDIQLALNTQLAERRVAASRAAAALQTACAARNPNLEALDRRAQRATLAVAELRIAIRAITLNHVKRRRAA
jgi:hypothetical protein